MPNDSSLINWSHLTRFASNIIDKFDDVYSGLNYSVTNEQGSISNGVESDNVARVRTGYMNNIKSIRIHVNDSDYSDYGCHVLVYSDKKIYIDKYTFAITKSTTNISKDEIIENIDTDFEYVRLVFYKTDNTAISTETFSVSYSINIENLSDSVKDKFDGIYAGLNYSIDIESGGISNGVESANVARARTGYMNNIKSISIDVNSVDYSDYGCHVLVYSNKKLYIDRYAFAITNSTTIITKDEIVENIDTDFDYIRLVFYKTDNSTISPETFSVSYSVDIENISDSIDKKISFDKNIPIVIGGIGGTDGKDAVRTDRVRMSEYVRLPAAFNNIPVGYQYIPSYYDTEKSFSSTGSWTDTTETVAINTNSGYVRFTFRNSENTELDSDDVAAFSNVSVNVSSIAELEEKTDELSKTVSEITDKYKVVSTNQIARLGWNVYDIYTPPQQSLNSYALAYKNGIRIMLADIRTTSDGYYVCLHDDDLGADLNTNYFRHEDGTELTSSEKSTLISDLTLDELLELDAGLYKGEAYRGMTVLMLSDFLQWCGSLGCRPMLETKVELDESQIIEIASMCKKYNVFEDTIILEDSSYLVSNIEYWKTNFNGAEMFGVRGGDRNYSQAVSLCEELISSGFKVMLSFTNYESIATHFDELKTKGIRTEYSEITMNNIETIYNSGILHNINYPVSSYYNMVEYKINKLM